MPLLTRRGLDTFESFWNLPRQWVEEPNKRRKGWSGVSRLEFLDNEAGHLTLFVKRQENHNYLSVQHPFHGRPTFFRDLHYTLRLRKIGLPTAEPVFYGERREGNRSRAVLTTVGLDGHKDLNSLLRDQSLTASLRQSILRRLADIVRLMHDNCYQHDSLGGNHVLVKLEGNGGIDLRIIDFEKTRYNFRRLDAAVRDLEKFMRHTPGLTADERTDFLLHYTRRFSVARRNRLVEKINRRLIFKCSKRGMPVLNINLAG